MIVSAESSFVVTVIAVHISAALVGVVATGTIAHLACRRLVFDEPVSDPALINQLQSLGILALCIVIGSSATLLVLWMELYCIPGDEPMIFRIDPARVPGKTMAKLMLALVLAVCVLAIDRYPLLALRDFSRTGRQTGNLREFFELSLFASAPFICWLAIVGIALIPALRTWSASSLLIATATIWLLVVCTLLLMSFVVRAQARPHIGSSFLPGAIARHAILPSSQLSVDTNSEDESAPLFTLRDAEIGELTASVTRDPATGAYRPIIRLILPPETDSPNATQSVVWHTEAEFVVEIAAADATCQPAPMQFKQNDTRAHAQDRSKFRAA